MDLGTDVANVATRVGTELSKEAAKMTNETMKQLLLYLIQKAKEGGNKAGEVSLKKLRESNEEIKVFDLPKDQMNDFIVEAKFYGVTFSALEENADNYAILYKSSEEARIKRILKNLIEQSVGEHSIENEETPEVENSETEKNRDRKIVGKLLEHGEAPYEHDPNNEKSYYAKIMTDQGEKTIWGVDLERAIREGGVDVGDEAEFENKGRQPVTVVKKERDEEGNVIGQTEIQTHRNTWDARPTLADKRKEVEPMVNGQKERVQVRTKNKEREGR